MADLTLQEEINERLIERKYFSSDFDHIQSLKKINLSNSSEIIQLKSKVGEKNFNELISKNLQLKSKLNNYYLYYAKFKGY